MSAPAIARPTLFDPEDGRWLFGAGTDIAVFGGSALASLSLLSLGYALGILEGDAPAWVWLLCVVGVDVAHVWATLYRVYLDGAELRRRPLLYLGAPLGCYVAGAALHATDPALFWRVLAYVAVYHFIRQQAGWVRLYHRRDESIGRLDRGLDTLAIYTATVYPVLHWHGHLPRAFAWFMHGDFVDTIGHTAASTLQPLYWAIMLGFVARRLQQLVTRRRVHVGTTLIVLSTWACWHLGIVTFDSDYAFTVTNVIIHGVPYFALTVRYGRMRAAMGAPLLSRLTRGGAAPMVGLLLLIAVLEEGLWERYVWHDHSWLAGTGPVLSELTLALLVPLLSLPQAVHYVLDGIVWRRRGNPLLS